MNLLEIAYPVFRLGSEKPNEEDGVKYYIYDRVDKEGEIYQVVRLLDDTTIPDPKLSQRRLKMKDAGVNLVKLSKAIFFMGDLIKLANPRTWFIDSYGKVFQYSKVTRAKLKFHKIRQIIPISTGGFIVEVEGIASRFKCLYKPDVCEYAGILHYGMSPILYGIYPEKLKDTWRMV